MKGIQHIIEYAALRCFAAVVRLFPLPAARFFARRLADLVFFVVPVRKKVVLSNLTAAFGEEKDRDEINKIALGVYRQFAQSMVEILFFPKMDKARLEKLVKFENLDILKEPFTKGKGAILVGSHFCNWELMAAATAAHYPVTLVVGQQRNSLVDDLLNSYRLMMGVKIVPLKLSLRGVAKALKNNEFVALVSDQDAHEDGVFVDFFGRPASTPKGAAVFALRFGCPLIMGHIFRDGAGFRVVFDIVPKPQDSGDEQENIRSYTAAYTKILENYIRKYPDHWFWMHKRWKTKLGQEIIKR